MSDIKQEWEEYKNRELTGLTPILKEYGFELEQEQIHLAGERFLMQAVTTTHGKKLILIGRRLSDNKKVIIKATSEKEGKKELEHERTCRRLLQEIDFAYETFSSPEEILFIKQNGYVLSIQAFIEQTCSFLERPIEEQFTFALKAFKAQESAHATTYKHRRLIVNTFGNREASDYIETFKDFCNNIEKHAPNNTRLEKLLGKAKNLLETNITTIEQYSGFLTHTDFVPHNFRIAEGHIYLLDYSSLRFGNKYEGWARFLNFMVLYNPPLEQALIEYVKNNRSQEELESLHLMRIFRLGEIIWYYINTLERSTGDLKELNEVRVLFWTHILTCVLDKEKIPQVMVEEYKQKRDALRTGDEKKRQVGLH